MTNADTVRELYAAFGHRDIPAILDLLTDDVEWGEPENPYNPAGGTRHGHAGFLEWLAIGRDAEDITVLDPHTFIAEGNKVAVVGFMECLAKPTGRTYTSDFVHVIDFRDGKIARFQELFDTHAAGEAFRIEAANGGCVVKQPSLRNHRGDSGGPMAEPSKVLQRGETAVHYWLAGPEDAPLVVLTHGATSDHTMFDDLVPSLAPHYRVLTWDVPGHGLSQPLPGDFGMDRLVEDVLALLDLVGSAAAVFLGQSMGGNLSQEVVFRHPERVSALVLIDCSDNFQRLSALEKASLASAGPLFALYPFKALKRQSADASAYTAHARERLAAMMDRVVDKKSFVEILMRTTDVLHYEPDFRIQCPLLMLLGEHDRLGNIAKAMPAMARLQGAEFEVVCGAGHAANMDRPDEVNSAILSFLAALSNKGIERTASAPDPAEPEHLPAVTPKARLGHGLARFFMGTFALSWLVWIPAAFTGQKAMEFPTVLLYALGGFAPTIIGLRMLYRTAPVDLRRSFWHRLVDFKAIRPGWYAMIVLIFPVITGLGMLINTLLGGEQPGMMQWKQIAADPPMLVVSLLMSLVITLFLGPLSEELGWRGFALDRMITRWGFFRAALLLGLVWGAWHLPLFFIPGTTHYIWGFGSAFFWLFLATMVPLSLLVALAYQQNSRSILAAVLMHMMYNYVISMVFPVPLQLQILITVLLYLVTAGLVWRYVRKVPLAVLAPTLQA